MSQTAKGSIFLCLVIICMSVRCHAATHEKFLCSTDICNVYADDQFCSIREMKCRDCSTIRDDCHKLHLPVNCTSWCIRYNVDKAVQVAKAQYCTKLEVIDNGSHNMSGDDDVSPGNVVVFTCKKGFKIKGRSILKCKDYGQWSNDAPTCEAVTCIMPPPIENGAWVPRYSTTDASFGTNLTVKCSAGYRTKDTYAWTCSETGAWTQLGNRNMPVCSEVEENRDESKAWMILTITLLVILTSLGCYNLERFRRKRRRRRKSKKLSEQQKQKFKSDVSEEAVNDSKTAVNNAETEHLLKMENELPNDISLQENKQRRSKAVVRNYEGSENHPLPNPTVLNNTIGSLSIDSPGNGVQLQVNINNSTGNTNTMKNMSNGVKSSTVERPGRNDNSDEAYAKEPQVNHTAEKMPIEEVSTSATAQPQHSNDSKIKMDIGGQTVIRDETI